MEYRVDQILDGWFGEAPDQSDDEQNRLRNLYAPLRKLEDELRKAQDKLSAQSWHYSPDRSGGQFTPQELDPSNTWR